MKVRVVCVGKMKDDYFAKAQAEYVKMLSRFCDVIIEELADEPLTNVRGEKAERTVKEAEGQRILARLSGFVICCDVQGKRMTSEMFAEKISAVMLDGGSELCFVIGGSLGLSQAVLERANWKLSFSDMTMPHRLFRVVLLEQVFRAFKILNRETYHK